MISIKLHWENFWAAGKSAQSLALFRVLFFTLGLLLIDRPHFPESINSIEFWHPVGIFRIFPGPIIGFDLFKNLWILWKVLSVFAIFGFFYRFTGILSALTFLIVSGYDYNFGHVYHSYHVYLMTLIILSISPAADAFSVDGLLFHKNKQLKTSWIYGWPMKLIMVHIVWVHALNAFLKLWTSGYKWIFSDNLLLHAFYVPNLPVTTENLMKMMPNVFVVLAGTIIFIQLTSFLSLFSSKLSLIYVLLWAAFHFGVTIIFGGHQTFYTQIYCYFVFPIYFYGESILKTAATFLGKRSQ